MLHESTLPGTPVRTPTNRVGTLDRITRERRLDNKESAAVRAVVKLKLQVAAPNPGMPGAARQALIEHYALVEYDIKDCEVVQ